MKLQDQMYDAVADVSADLSALVDGARRRGRVVRRRRRIAIGSTAAAVAVGAVGVAFALHRTAPSATDVSPASGGASASGTAPNTGRTTVAALQAAVDDVDHGKASDFAGQDPVTNLTPPDPESYGEFLFAPDSGGPAGAVEVNIQDLSVLSGEPRTCDPTYMTDCHVAKLPGGDLLRTYVDRESSSTPGVYRNVAELISPGRHLRVVAGASNSGLDDHIKTRPDAVLSIAQVSKVVTEPWWGFKLPAAYAQAGKQLSSYDDLTQNAESTSDLPASSSPGTPSGGPAAPGATPSGH